MEWQHLPLPLLSISVALHLSSSLQCSLCIVIYPHVGRAYVLAAVQQKGLPRDVYYECYSLHPRGRWSKKFPFWSMCIVLQFADSHQRYNWNLSGGKYLIQRQKYQNNNPCLTVTSLFNNSEEKLQVTTIKKETVSKYCSW